MLDNRSWLALTVLVLLAVPARAAVVLEENFEDDIVDDSATFIIDGNGDQVLVQHQQNGPPTNAGNPGTWIANKYKVGSPTEDGQGFQGGQWFDSADVNPDTNWQFGLIRDLRKVRTLPPQSQTGENRDMRIPERPGNEGFLISHHQGDCSAANPCNVPGEVGFPSIRLNRGGFIQFTDAAGTPVIAEQGDTLRFSMEFSGAEGNTALGFTNDIQAMVDRTADENLNPPYSKWNVGFGQPFVPLQPDLGGWQGYVMDPHVLIQVEFINGFNQEWFGSRWQTADTVASDQCMEGDGVNCSRNVELVPDTDQCFDSLRDLEICGPLTDESCSSAISTRPT